MGWRYYKSMIQHVGNPSNNVLLTKQEIKELFSQHKNALLIRYTTHLDQTDSKDWFFCLKDTPYDFNGLKSKRKNVIRKGIENFTVREIQASMYIRELHELINDAYKGYEHPNFITYQQAEKKAIAIDQNPNYHMLGAFSNEDQQLVGYVWFHVNGACISISEQKAIRAFESKGVNAALLHSLCTLYNNQYFPNHYLCDGERNVLHKTAFQDYLIKYFGFRYAYCNLHIVFNPRFAIFINLSIAALPVYGWLLKKANPRLYTQIIGVKRLKELSGR